MFDVEVLLIAKALEIKVSEIPVQWEEVVGSKLRVMRDSIGMLIDLLVMRANFLTGRWKI